MKHEYDPLDFHHGIEQLEQAENLPDLPHRKSILELMLRDLETIGGNLADELIHYVAELYMFDDDAVDLQKLHALHYELSVYWASNTDYELHKAKKWMKDALPVTRTGKKVLEAASKGGSSSAVWPQRAKEMQRAIDALHSEKPGISYEEMKRMASKRHGYPLSALKRYTKNPRKK